MNDDLYDCPVPTEELTQLLSKDKSQHTPGPWESHKMKTLKDGGSIYNPEDLEETYLEDGTPYMEIVTHHYPKSGFNITGYMSEADARLMAAAPDLLYALKLSKDHLEFIKHNTYERDVAIIEKRVYDVTNDAINKAEGKI